MTRFKAVAVGALAVVLAAAPVSSAFADRGGRHYYGNPFYPIVGLAAAVVGTAAAVLTLPFVAIDAALRAPGYYPPSQGYAPAPAYGPPPVAHDDYVPTEPYYAPPAPAPQAYYPEAYYPAPAVTYYAAPEVPYYYARPAPYYAPRAVYYGGYGGYRGYEGGYRGHEGGYRGYDGGNRGHGGYAPNVGYTPRGNHGSAPYPQSAGQYAPRPATYGSQSGTARAPHGAAGDYRSR